MKKLIKCFIALSIIIGTGIQANAQVDVGISVTIAPPALPVYTQPYCPGDGYLWIPGYWSYSDGDYYWVPGTWILPPQYGLLWTPGYWGFSGGYYGWHGGYWGRHVGFYGGIDYGFGYGGRGYEGGRWQGNTFRYNTAVTNVNTTVIHNTYVDKTVIKNTTIINNNRTSFNGQGGVAVKPTQQEQLASRETHVKPTAAQLTHESSARADKSQFASVNHGHPGKLTEVAPDNHSANPQDHTKQNTVAVKQHQQVQKNNKVANVNRQVHQNAPNKDKQEVTNVDKLRNKQTNANNERKQAQTNQRPVKSQQVTVQHQPQHVTVQHQQQHVTVQHQPQHVTVQHQQQHVNVQHQTQHVNVQHQPQQVNAQHQSHPQPGGGEKGDNKEKAGK